jgi:hypothetical protein
MSRIIVAIVISLATVMGGLAWANSAKPLLWVLNERSAREAHDRKLALLDQNETEILVALRKGPLETECFDPSMWEALAILQRAERIRGSSGAWELAQ